MLSDVVMPKMDGYELYTTIRKPHPDLPVLMMTAFHYDKDHIIKRSRLEGLEGVIFKKPVDPDRLREVILETVGNRKARYRQSLRRARGRRAPRRCAHPPRAARALPRATWRPS